MQQKSKVNILYVNHVGKVSGGETSLLNYITNLDREKFESFMVCPHGELASRAASLGVNIIPMQMWILGRNVFKYLWTVIKLFSVIRRNRIDIVHVSGAGSNQYAAIAAKLTGRLLVVHFHNVRSARDIRKYLVNMADRIIVNSEFTLNSIKNYIKDVSKIRLVYYGIDIESFSSTDGKRVKEEFGIRTENKLVGIIGLLEERKGHEYFLKAAKVIKDKLGDVNFIVAGSSVFTDRSYENNTRELAVQLGLNEDVIFTGYRRDIREILSGLDVLICPYREEPFGMVLIEAQASRVPIVAFNSGGIPEIIKNGQTGYMVDLGNWQALADKGLDIMTNSSVAERFASNGFEEVRSKFSSKIATSNLCEVYKELI